METDLVLFYGFIGLVFIIVSVGMTSREDDE